MKSLMTSEDKMFFKKEGIIVRELAEDIWSDSKYEYWVRRYMRTVRL